MMPEISLNILDVAENSVSGGRLSDRDHGFRTAGCGQYDSYHQKITAAA